MELALRQRIRDALLGTTSPALQAFAQAMVLRDSDRMACWGNLADHVLDHVVRDDDRIALWRVLVDIADRRPLLVFLDLNRDRPGVLRAVLEDVAHLPATLQCALVSMPEAQALLAPVVARLHPAALEVLEAGEEAKGRERVLYEAHMKSLRAQRAAAPPCFPEEHPFTASDDEVSKAPTPGAPS
jgi:hypothetical protein